MAKPSQPQQPVVSEVRATPPEKLANIRSRRDRSTLTADAYGSWAFRGCDPVGIVHRVGIPGVSRFTR